MIDRTLVFMKDRLNAHLGAKTGTPPDTSIEELVVFADADKVDPIAFKTGAVTALLVNVEQERTLRAPDPFARTAADGTMHRVHPEIRLNLYVLFVLRFKPYEQGLRYLSEIIRYFQVNPVFDSHDAPELGEDFERVLFELVTLPLAQQNELWGQLRSTYHPSVLYKVGLVVFRDEGAIAIPPVRELNLIHTPDNAV